MLDPKVEARVLAALNHEEGDRVPIFDYIDNRDIVDHFSPGWTDYDAAMVKVYHSLGIDICRGYGGSYSENDNGTVIPVGEHVEHKISGRTRWLSKRPIKNLDDIRKYIRQPVPEEWIYDNWIQRMRADQARFEPHTMWVPCTGCGFHATYGLMGQELFCYAIYDEPTGIERILEVETESQYRLCKASAEAKIAPLHMIGDDIAYKYKLMFSPDFLRRTFIKSLKKCIEPLKAAGIKVVFHSDGYLMEILDDLVDAGIDALHPIEPIAGMNIDLIKKRYGKNLTLCGGVDCSQVLPLGSVQDVIDTTKQILSTAGHGGGLIIGSSSEIVPCTPVENIIAFYDACRKWGTYPLGV